jgi:hypothetical protein
LTVHNTRPMQQWPLICLPFILIFISLSGHFAQSRDMLLWCELVASAVRISGHVVTSLLLQWSSDTYR